MTNFIPLCVITSAHGLKGHVKLKPYTESLDGITAYGALNSEDGTPYPFTITGETKGQLIVLLDGITDRNDAEKLRGVKLGVPRERLPELEEDDFYIEDLVGLNVITEDGAAFGSVKAVVNFGAGDLVEIKPTEGKAELYAFTHATFPSVDLTAGTLTFAAPELVVAKEEAAE